MLADRLSNDSYFQGRRFLCTHCRMHSIRCDLYYNPINNVTSLSFSCSYCGAYTIGYVSDVVMRDQILLRDIVSKCLDKMNSNYHKRKVKPSMILSREDNTDVDALIDSMVRDADVADGLF